MDDAEIAGRALLACTLLILAAGAAELLRWLLA